MKATSISNIGRQGQGFTVAVEVKDLTDAQLQELVNRGLRWSVQRVSEIDLAIGVARKDGKKTIRFGKRGDATFSESKADALVDVITSALASDEALPLKSVVVVSASEGEAKDYAFKFERGVLAEKLAKGAKIMDIAEKIGFAGEVFQEEANENGEYDYSKEFLTTLKAHFDKVKAAALEAAMA